MTWTYQQSRLPIATPTSVPRIDLYPKILTLLLLIFLIDAAPIPATQPTTDWADTPRERGTLTILFSCGAALGLCVWTGVHLNVDPGASGGYKRSTIETVSRFLGKSVWALIALFAPDIVLTVALHQFLVAYEYQRAVNEFAEKKNAQSGEGPVVPTETPAANVKRVSTMDSHSEPQKKKKKQMELKMAFFATMGGFCVEEMTVDGPRWKSLKVDTLRRLRTMDILHDYPLSEIDDKSKASGIAKTIACFQTGWILLQCLARHLEGLHITMLELNTSVHVLIAIVMYGVWWNKPFDVERSIAIDRYGLCDNSITTVYVDKVRSILEEAERKIIKHAEIRPLSTIGRSEIQPDNRRRQSALTLTSQITSQVTCPQIRAIRAAVTIFRSIGEAPEDASRMFRAVPTAIKDHFTKNILRRDIKSGLLQNYKNIKNVNRDVLEVAYKEAFDAANETAFRVARKNVLKAAQEYRSKRTKHETDQDRKKLLEELGIALTEALQKTRSASFTAAYRAAHSAAVRSESESTDGQNSPSNLNTLDTETAPRILLPDSLKGATELGINQLGLKEPTDSTIDLITMLSTSPQTEVLQGIIEESTSETVRPQSTGLDTDPVSRKVPAVQCKQKQSISSSLPAAFRSACAASRAASRHAVRLVALDAALGPSGAADASEAAIWRFTGDFYGNHFIEDFQESDFAEIVSEAKKTTKKTFRQHFDRAAADVDTNIGVTADIVERSTATGIFIAAQKAIETAKKTLPHGAHDFSMMSSMIAMTTSGIAASCMMSMDETVASQQPVKSTESSKGPQVTVSKKSSDQAKACEDAENILLSKAFQNIELARNPSISTRLLSSLKTAGTVVQDQLMDVPGLFTPSKQQSRRIRKPRSTDGKRAFGSAWRYYHRIALLLFSGISGAFYGAMHMSKWHSEWFPTPTEHLLWKIACIAGSAAVFPIGLMALIPFISNRYNYYRIILLTLCTASWAVFGIARLYLIAESFISLRKLPVEAYKMAQWTDAIPHV